MLGIQEVVIMEGCSEKVILPPKSTKSCADGGVLEPKVIEAHNTSRSSTNSLLKIYC